MLRLSGPSGSASYAWLTPVPLTDGLPFEAVCEVGHNRKIRSSGVKSRGFFCGVNCKRGEVI